MQYWSALLLRHLDKWNPPLYQAFQTFSERCSIIHPTQRSIHPIPIHPPKMTKVAVIGRTWLNVDENGQNIHPCKYPPLVQWKGSSKVLYHSRQIFTPSGKYPPLEKIHPWKISTRGAVESLLHHADKWNCSSAALLLSTQLPLQSWRHFFCYLQD